MLEGKGRGGGVYNRDRDTKHTLKGGEGVHRREREEERLGCTREGERWNSV